MDDPGNRIRRIKPKADNRRTESGDSKRRITKFDGKLFDYAAIKSSTGIVVPEVKKVILDRKKKDAEHSSHRTNIIYPSEMAREQWCPRATYYRMSGNPDPQSSSSFTLENVFAEGNAIHAKWQNWLASTGLLWGDWRCARCSEYVRNSLKPESNQFGPCIGTSWVELNPEVNWGEQDFPHDWKYKEVTLQSSTHKISGHADGALVKHNCLIEIKSVGIGTLKFEAPKLTAENTHEIDGKNVIDIDGLWKDLHRPLLSHVKQGNIYLWMAQQMNLPFNSIVFLYEFKANQKIKEFQIKMSQDILKPLLDTAAGVEYALARGVPPGCPFNGCGQCRAYEKDR